MIQWTIPAAFAGLVLLAGPVLAHMLMRRHARRVVFPTTRFLQVTRAAAARIRTPSDIPLLSLRLGIVLAAVLAAAQPVLLASWRTAAWDRRVARAVVLDTSATVAAIPAAAQAAEQEMRAFTSARFAGADLRAELRRATEWIVATPPARREIVVVSDFQRGTLDEQAVRAIPQGIGIRFIAFRRDEAPKRHFLPVVSGWRGALWIPSIIVSDDHLRATWLRGQTPDPPAWISTAQPTQDTDAATRAVQAAVSFGFPATDLNERVVVAFRDAPPLPSEKPIEDLSMLRALAAIRQSELLNEIDVQVEGKQSQNALIVHTHVAATDAVAPAVVRAVMTAVRRLIVDWELETATLADTTLAAWRREPAPVAVTPGGIASDGTEARCLWALSLVLLGVETWLRQRRSAGGARSEQARAA